MNHLEKFPLEFSKPFKICFDVLDRSNIRVFDGNISFVKKHRRSLVIVPCTIAYYTSLLAYISKIFTEGLEFFELAYIVPVLMACTQGILKVAIFVQKMGILRVIIVQLGSIWQTNLNPEVGKKKDIFLKKLNFFHALFYWVNILGSWQYMLVPFAETLFHRFILQQDSEFLFPFASRFPFDPTKSWLRYILVYIFQVYSMLQIVNIYIGPELLMVTLCSHLSTQFTILQDDLLHVRPMSSKNRMNDVTGTIGCDERTMALKYIVRRHQKLILISERLDDVFNKIIFVNLLSATITICFFGFVAKVSRGPVDIANNFVAAFASMLPILNLCYYGDLLTKSSAAVADAAYKNIWYKGDTKYKKIIWIIMKRSQSPCCLTSLRYVPISLNTFSKVLSTTWSYFSLATSVYEEN